MYSLKHDSIAFDYLPNLRKLIIKGGYIDETFELPKNKHFKQLEF